jgi:hypothetical protein
MSDQLFTLANSPGNGAVIRFVRLRDANECMAVVDRLTDAGAAGASALIAIADLHFKTPSFSWF